MEPESHVLVVDDEPQILLAIRRYLSRQRPSWKVQTANNAEEAEECLAAQNFDVVLTDVNMPGRSGLDLLRSLRQSEATRDIPVVMLTGRRDDELKATALDLDATDLLVKPVQPSDLVARLSNALRLKHMQDALKAQNAELEDRVKERTVQLEKAREEVVWRLAKAGEYRDEDTGNHILRVGCYGKEIALAMGLGAQHAELIYMTSPLHDIGKIGIPDAILLKEGKLTAPEWTVMKTHCQVGADILLGPAKSTRPVKQEPGQRSSIQEDTQQDLIISEAARIALSHHERWDGSGYPHGLAGEDILFDARITAIADVYDALRSVRPYKPAFSHPKAVGIMKEGAGTQFDPRIFTVFESLSSSFEAIYAELTDG